MRRDRRLRASRGPIAINASARGERPRRCPEVALGAPRPTVATMARRAGRERSPMSGRRRARPIRGRARRARSRSLRTRAGSERSVHASRPERRALRARMRPCIPHGVYRDGIGEPSPHRASDDTNEPTFVVACARMCAAHASRRIANGRRVRCGGSRRGRYGGNRNMRSAGHRVRSMKSTVAESFFRSTASREPLCVRCRCFGDLGSVRAGRDYTSVCCFGVKANDAVLRLQSLFRTRAHAFRGDGAAAIRERRGSSSPREKRFQR